MSVWICAPSARPVSEVEPWVALWQSKGYLVSLWRDPGAGIPENADEVQVAPYPGWAQAANALIASAFRWDRKCDWTVCAGDDTEPDACHTADEIAAQCTSYFGGLSLREHWKDMRTFGVMQPTGDRWADHLGVIIERICGSPWLGREFCRRINQGEGPFWNGYRHNWADEELQNVAIKLGILWQRPDLIHLHNHTLRHPGGRLAPHQQGFARDYTTYKPLFKARQAAGFPGSEPL